MIVFCGPTGVGKTTLAQLLVASQPQAVVHWLGDLRMADEVRTALELSARAPVIAVVRSGESMGLRSRWSDMALSRSLINAASVVTATLRRVARRQPEHAPPSAPDAFVVEVLAPDGTPLTGSLAAEARALVEAGITSADEARFNVPHYG